MCGKKSAIIARIHSLFKTKTPALSEFTAIKYRLTMTFLIGLLPRGDIDNF